MYSCTNHHHTTLPEQAHFQATGRVDDRNATKLKSATAGLGKLPRVDLASLWLLVLKQQQQRESTMVEQFGSE